MNTRQDIDQNLIMFAFDRFKFTAGRVDSLLCVGLDPTESLLDRFFEIHLDTIKTESRAKNAELFCRFLINSTKDLVCCYKPNSAFFEALGPDGFAVLKNVCDYINDLDIPIILDAKRGDIGSTAEAYAFAAYKIFNATAVTINPYLGIDSLQPFVEPYPEKGIFVLCRTSNSGSKDLQEKRICTSNDQESQFLYEVVAAMIQNSQVLTRATGFVVGATQPEALRRIRNRYVDVWILSPGIGEQQGDLVECISAGLRDDGYGLIIPISRAIAAADNPRETAQYFKNRINEIRQNVQRTRNVNI